MSVSIDIQKKPKRENVEKIQLNSPTIVLTLKEVKAIRDAIQEHLLFIGLDRGNNIRNISFIGIGTSSHISIDSKDIIRTALTTASEGVILVHNHPSNNLKPSKEDNHLTNITNKLLDVFNIKLLDHIIVTEEDYVSMKETGHIKNNYEDFNMNVLDRGMLLEENMVLKNKIKKWERKVQHKSKKEHELER